QPVPVRQISLAHRLLGEAFAATGRQLVDQTGGGFQQIHCAGLGGHHAWHEPDGRYPSTLGLGMAAVVAERTGVTVLSDFRSRDLAAGGRGTSLTALVDHLLFRDEREARVLVHLGGLASVVFLPADARPRQILGFHAGPCNVLLDALMRHLTSGRETFDPGGKHAVQGCCIEPVLERWLAHPSIQRRPPRTIPVQAFGDEFAAQAVQQARQAQSGLHDLLCTATHFVARCVGEALTRYLPEKPARVLLSGGGIRNGFLWKLLEQQVGGLPLETIDRYGVPGGARKAAAFAGLAALTLDGVPANLTTATGAGGSRLLGSLTPGTPPNWARCVAWMGALGAPPLPVRPQAA
ncbi:MAG TPA: anhydro-N-acetylmuramic acid kinase, partial [Gemmataceae bacterium]|nr:anhydro-N-acetylmuramic acid kinase [Gemmataceae bacterium]